MQLDYTVPTSKSHEEAVQAVVDAAQANGFSVPFVNRLSKTLSDKGFVREATTIIEMCNAKHAAAVLERDVKIGLMFPCPVLVYNENGAVFVTTMRPSLIGSFYPEAGIDVIADEVETAILAIVDEAAAS
ncbi:MAG: DUF302 domain-containing protein [Coriobacteriia bacterium]|nr:DUF302 domain-containing protein [Coriobacteriia bacterium]